MNKALFLCLVVLCAAVVFAAEDLQKAKHAPFKRGAAGAAPCFCPDKVDRGDLWMFRGDCPGGYGYTSDCYVWPNICCYPH
uniref:Kappa-actitoxin-Avd4i n=1 Tax=Anemonia viridis TaxID=51769 RepID=BDSB_ANEVI|nr:RecName: Full=Kappa-actitoxin-Avd4i; Short=Kappa-AITX-Avd4i; AltName: Full=Antihypertensive protein BDS-11; AltName: Full=Antihypertensive protein BDS-9; AltName: Full=Blood depressing substance 11; Short=BDS-11; AltName: Full=Blood depressing substance 9; Short=BDS-9; AltName: Full=Kappa-actitoxin-Avd4k; Short=Kappa-AITX-Avd4k; Flags: Precursor [Anemonia viridis]